MQYCIYLRKSRADLEAEAHGEGETLARHESMLLSLAKKLNISIVQIYREIVSGESISARPAMQQLLNEVEDGMWDGVLVMEIERLARGDTIDQGIVARAFKQHNTKIITPIKTYDPANEFDEEYFEFGLFMSRREYKTINRRIQRGRVQSAKDGKYIGSGSPYGYDKVKIQNDKGYTLALNDESEIVKLIYDLYISGIGMTVIANILDERGIKPRHTPFWSKSTISDILKNPVYTGKIRWSYKKEKKDYETGKKTRFKSDSCILVDGLHPAIVSAETFAKAQEMMRRNRTNTTKQGLTLKNPLSGVVYCGKCGALMTRLGESTRNLAATLRCSNRYCDNVSSPISLIEEVVVENLTNWLEEYIIELEKLDFSDNKEKINTKALKELKKELESVNNQSLKTYDLLEQGVYDIEMFKSRNGMLSTRIKEIQEKIKAIEEQEEKRISYKDLYNVVLPEKLKTLKNYDKLTVEARNDVLKSLLQKAVYVKDKANTRGKKYTKNFSLDIFPNLPDELPIS